MSRRILLDECLPRKLADLLDGEAVTTVPKQGWASKRNGELLTLASLEFDVFVTHDENLEHQQNLAEFDIGIVVIHAASNRLADIQPLREAIIEAIRTVNPGCADPMGFHGHRYEDEHFDPTGTGFRLYTHKITICRGERFRTVAAGSLLAAESSRNHVTMRG